MTGVEQMKACFRAVMEIPAAILGLEGYCLEEGCNADLVILQAKDAVEALRLKANRLFVIRRGKVISTSPPAESHLNLPGRPKIQNYIF